MKSSKMLGHIFIATIKEIDYRSWKIKFKVKDIIDKMEEYPTALPLSNHTFQLYEDDEVLVISSLDITNNQYYYIPLSHYKYVGTRHKNSFYDITRDDIADAQSPELYEFYNNTHKRTTEKLTEITNNEELNINSRSVVIPVSGSADQNSADAILTRTPWKVITLPNGTDTYKLTGIRSETITGSDTYLLTGPRTETIKGSDNYNLTGDRKIVTTKEYHITSNTQIKLIVGDSSITLDPDNLVIQCGDHGININNTTGGSFFGIWDWPVPKHIECDYLTVNGKARILGNPVPFPTSISSNGLLGASASDFSSNRVLEVKESLKVYELADKSIYHDIRIDNNAVIHDMRSSYDVSNNRDRSIRLITWNTKNEANLYLNTGYKCDIFSYNSSSLIKLGSSTQYNSIYSGTDKVYIDARNNRTQIIMEAESEAKVSTKFYNQDNTIAKEAYMVANSNDSNLNCDTLYINNDGRIGRSLGVGNNASGISGRITTSTISTSYFGTSSIIKSLDPIKVTIDGRQKTLWGHDGW